MEIIAQAFGIMALICSIICYQYNSQKKILIIQIIASAMFIVNLGLLGAWSGALLNIHGIIRAIVFYQRGKYKWADSKAVLWIMIILGAVCVAVTYSSPLDILPLVGTVFTTLAYYCTDPRKIRLLTMPSPPCWFIYHFANHSIGGALNEVFVFSSIAVAMIRYRKKRED